MTMATVPDVDRLLVPQIHDVLAVTEEIPDVVTLRVAPVDGPPRPFLPAQVGMVGAFGIGEAAISISSPATETDHHEYTIRRAGAITGALTRLRPGDQLWVRGPFGTPWDLELDGRDVVVAAGGIGLAPLRAAVHALARRRDRYERVVLVVGARSPDLLLYERQYDDWRRSGLEVVVTVDRGDASWDGRVGFVPDAVVQVLDELGADPARTSALVCGPDVMMRLVADALVARGTSPADVQLTLERNMQCGNGLCGHCQLGPLIVCRDGPVVRYPAVAAALAVPER